MGGIKCLLKNNQLKISWLYVSLVEHSGLEPLTSTLPVSRSSQMS